MDLVTAQRPYWQFPPTTPDATNEGMPIASTIAGPSQPNYFALQTPPQSNNAGSGDYISSASSSETREPPLPVDAWSGFPFRRCDDDISGRSYANRIYAWNEETSNKSPIRDYDLRPGPREDPDNVFTTWLDKDDSGNYDPFAKFERQQVVKRKNDLDRAPRAIGVLEGGPAKRAKIISPLAARQEGVSFIVTLKLKSPQAKQEFKRYQGQDNWPEEPWNKLALPDPDRSDDHPNTWEEPGAYKLRSRYNNDPSFRPFQESSPIQEDLTGHPAARGCVACYKIGQICPLLKDPLNYPCSLCKDDDYECELITSPKWKRKCEGCRRKKLRCSYRYKPHDEEEHKLPCSECSEAGHHCIAGPRVDDPTDPLIRIDLDFDWKKYRHPALEKLEKKRLFIACALCRRNKKRCSLLRTRDSPPCKTCKDAGLKCTFEALETPTSRGKTTISNQQASAESSKCGQATEDIYIPGAPIPHWSQIRETSKPRDSPIAIDATSESNSHEHGDLIDGDGAFVINTAFAHPIRFNYDPDYERLGPCHFCSIARYGLFGLGFRSVTVVEWEPGAGYEEITNGHRSDDGEETSRMCTYCTSSRMRICACEAHEIQPLQPYLLPPEKLDQQAAYNAVLNPPTNDLKHVEYGWCSICPALAQYVCMARQETNALGEPVPPKAKAELGCGLYLCDTCAMAMIAKRGDLQAMLKEGPEAQLDNREEDEKVDDEDMDEHAENKQGRWPGGWRADAELLRADGLMMRAVFAGF